MITMHAGCRRAFKPDNVKREFLIEISSVNVLFDSPLADIRLLMKAKALTLKAMEMMET